MNDQSNENIVSNNGNKMVIVLLCVIIAILTGIIVLFITGTIKVNDSNKSNNETVEKQDSNVEENNKDKDKDKEEDKKDNTDKKENKNLEYYKTFMKNKNYQADIKELVNQGEVLYAVDDVDRDNEEELIVKVAEKDDDFNEYLIYKVNNQTTISLFFRIYCYGSITYNKSKAELIINRTRPDSFGADYDFFGVKENGFEHYKTVGIEEGKYFINFGQDYKYITESEFNSYFDGYVNFNYNEL